MSMPQPIRVALVGASAKRVEDAAKHFRLSAPGIGAPYLASLDTPQGGKVLPVERIPRGLITLWLCLDSESLAASKWINSFSVWGISASLMRGCLSGMGDLRTAVQRLEEFKQCCAKRITSAYSERALWINSFYV